MRGAQNHRGLNLIYCIAINSHQKQACKKKKNPRDVLGDVHFKLPAQVTVTTLSLCIDSTLALSKESVT